MYIVAGFKLVDYRELSSQITFPNLDSRSNSRKTMLTLLQFGHFRMLFGLGQETSWRLITESTTLILLRTVRL
jgi:hypothetical protein